MSKSMLIRDHLEEMNKTELTQMCKERNIPRYIGKRAFTCAELVEKLCEYFEKFPDEVIMEDEESEVDAQVDEQNQEEIEVEVQVQEESTETKEVEELPPWEFKSRDNEVEEAEVGTLMAFLDLKGKIRTAAMVNRSSQKRRVKLVTEFEAEFVVPYENILWVKKGKRWPRAIYNMLKGNVK